MGWPAHEACFLAITQIRNNPPNTPHPYFFSIWPAGGPPAGRGAPQNGPPKMTKISRKPLVKQGFGAQKGSLLCRKVDVVNIQNSGPKSIFWSKNPGGGLQPQNGAKKTLPFRSLAERFRTGVGGFLLSNQWYIVWVIHPPTLCSTSPSLSAGCP